MGANLGFFAEDRERDFPELNKCPDCETFFADEYCPICGKPCPEEFRAGNRKAIKQKKHRRPQGNGRVQFVPWYHTVWFTVLMLIIQPIVGLILTWTGVWKTRWKVIATVLLVLSYMFYYGVGLFDAIIGRFNEPELPINLELSEDEYRSVCAQPDVEVLYRNGNTKIGEYVRVDLTVAEVGATYYYNEEFEYIEANVYLCQAQTADRTLEFFVIDYRQENQTRLAVGDSITVCGEVAGDVESNAGKSGAGLKLLGIYARFIDLQ